MARFALSLSLAAAFAISTQAQDLHLTEPGSKIVLSRSTFAHGYRHGYEEGYHIGNTDITLGAAPRAKLREARGLKLGYSSQFGPRHVFEQGFEAGLKAGYGDGYSGRLFRAVDSLRYVAAFLEEGNLPADSKSDNFDQGFFTGYNEGYESGGSDHSSSAQVDFRLVDCANSHSAKQSAPPPQASYCEGFRRGFALGHADGFVLRLDADRLEASK